MVEDQVAIQPANHDEEVEFDKVEGDKPSWKTNKYAYWNVFSCLRYDDKEITGYIMSGIARSSVGTYLGVFTVLALTALAEEAQDCSTGTLYFLGIEMKPSTVVATVLTMEGFVNGFCSPPFGALADSSSHRTLMFRVALTLLIVFAVTSGLLLFGFGSDWTLTTFAICLVVVALLFELQNVLHASYLPEVAQDDQAKVKIAGKFYGVTNIMQLTYIGVVFGITGALQISDDRILSTQVAALISLFLWMFWAIPGLAMLNPRAQRDFTSAGCCGLNRARVAIKQCWSQYTQLGLFLLAYSFSITGNAALIGLAATYLTSELGMTGGQFQAVVGTTAVCAVPGALLTNWLTKKVGNLKIANIVVLLFWIVSVGLIPVVLTGVPVIEDPSQTTNGTLSTTTSTTSCADVEGSVVIPREPSETAKIFVYPLAIAWGLGIGSIWPITVAFTAQLVPHGSEASMFGLKTFASKIWSFAPPLLFAVLNEAFSPRVAITSILPFLIIGVILITFIDMDKAKREIAHTSHLKYNNDAP